MDFNFIQSKFLDTVDMVEKYRLDIRTVTMGISLFECSHSETDTTVQAVYDHVTRRTARLVEVCGDIEAELGIPIVNRRIPVTLISLIAAGCEGDSTVVAKTLDRTVRDSGMNFLDGYPALVKKDATTSGKRLIDSIPHTLSGTELAYSPINIASSRAGINMDTVRRMGKMVKEATAQTIGRSSITRAKLVVFANAVGDSPFMAGALRGIGEPDYVVSVDASGPGVVNRVLDDLEGASFNEVTKEIRKAAFRITHTGQLVSMAASGRLGMPFGIVNLSLTPTAEMGGSVTYIFEHMGLGQIGTHGTTVTSALLDDTVKKDGLMACSRVGELSGSFISVSEDKGMIDTVQVGSIDMSKLEAVASICSVDFDTIAIPRDTPATTISGVVTDEAAIGVTNHKATATRLVPVPDTKPGNEVNSGGLLGYVPIIDVNAKGNTEFTVRGGYIPAPVHGFRN